ncbi:MAG: B12-binding domain-containing radical SAM protein [Candidatus Hermodarchaeota archaeon]
MMGRYDGKQVVLTASVAEMAGWDADPFMAFAGGFPGRLFPKTLLRRMYKPDPPNSDHSAPFAPYGLRKIEAKLLESGFDEEDVITVHPRQLKHVMGPKTKVVGVSSMDPLGMAYVSLTYTSLTGLGSVAATGLEFRRLMQDSALKKYRTPRILGGAGSWQLQNPKLREEFGFDCIVMGESERTAPKLFEKAIRGEPLPPIVRAERPDDDEITPIRNGAIYGAVEISRGCGRGCQFCSPTMKYRRTFSIEKILKEVRANLRCGADMILLNTDDVFLYGSKERFLPNRKAVVNLYKAVVAEPGVKVVQTAHASLAPAIIEPKMVQEITDTIGEKSRYKYRGNPVVTVEVGVETGSPRLMQEHMRGKALPYDVSQWPEIVCEAYGILNDANWLPLCTLVTGLPKETEEDVLLTLDLVHRMRRFKTFFVPLFFVSLEDCALRKEKTLNLRRLTELQWEIFIECWDHNLLHWRDAWLEDIQDTWINRQLIKLIGGFLYLGYYRFKHSGKSKRMLTRIAGIVGEDYRFMLPFTHPFGGEIPDSFRERNRISLLPVVPGSEDIPREMHYANHEAQYRVRQ